VGPLVTLIMCRRIMPAVERDLPSGTVTFLFTDAALVERFVAVDGDSYGDIRLRLGRVREAGRVGAEWQARWAALSRPASPMV